MRLPGWRGAQRCSWVGVWGWVCVEVERAIVVVGCVEGMMRVFVCADGGGPDTRGQAVGRGGEYAADRVYAYLPTYSLLHQQAPRPPARLPAACCLVRSAPLYGWLQPWQVVAGDVAVVASLCNCGQASGLPARPAFLLTCARCPGSAWQILNSNSNPKPCPGFQFTRLLTYLRFKCVHGRGVRQAASHLP